MASGLLELPENSGLGFVGAPGKQWPLLCWSYWKTVASALLELLENSGLGFVGAPRKQRLRLCWSYTGEE